MRRTTAQIAPPGSAFLEGPTVTVAGAKLLQRIAVAVTKVGPAASCRRRSSCRAAMPKAGSSAVIASCELDQRPSSNSCMSWKPHAILFLEQLAVQAPVAVSGAREGRLRVQLRSTGPVARVRNDLGQTLRRAATCRLVISQQWAAWTVGAVPTRGEPIGRQSQAGGADGSSTKLADDRARGNPLWAIPSTP